MKKIIMRNISLLVATCLCAGLAACSGAWNDVWNEINRGTNADSNTSIIIPPFKAIFGGSGSEANFIPDSLLAFPDILQTSDGGYVFIASTNSNDGNVSGNHGGYDMWVVKLDAARNLLWQVCVGSSGDESGFRIAESQDGGYIVLGTDSSCTSIVTKLTSTGEVQWQKTYGSPKLHFRDVMPTSDGGYLLAGYTYNTVLMAVLEKVDSLGNTQWQKNPASLGVSGLMSIKPTSDGGYIAAGFDNWGTLLDGTFTLFSTLWVVKMDSAGNSVWNYRSSTGPGIVGYLPNLAWDVQQTYDGGYIICGNAILNGHGGLDANVIKLNSSGVEQWSKVYGGSGHDIAYGIKQVSDGGYVFTGYTKSTDGDVSGNHGGSDLWLVKVDSLGNLLWQKCYGGTGDEVGYSLKKMPDGGYLIAGTTNSTDGDVSGNHGGYDVWVLKTDANGNM